MVDEYNPYVLPTISFVGGETQDMAFHVYFHENRRPFGMAGCDANFAIVSYMNKTGEPVLTKPMRAVMNEDGTADNVLTVTLQPQETVDLYGKYIYQISIKDVDGDVEIPQQGILIITHNINKAFITRSI